MVVYRDIRTGKLYRNISMTKISFYPKASYLQIKMLDLICTSNGYTDGQKNIIDKLWFLIIAKEIM